MRNVAVAVLVGVIVLCLSPGGARGETATTDMEVAVWRHLESGRVYAGARVPGGLWRWTLAMPDPAMPSASGRFHRSEDVAITVPLTGDGAATVEAVVWRSVADPPRLHLSVRPEGGRWRTLNAPLNMREIPRRASYSDGFARSEAVTVAVPRPAPPPAVTVTGPLAVFSTLEGATWTRTDAADLRRARNVHILDIPTGKYWRAFEFENVSNAGAEPAGERLIAWNARQVRRTGLDGRDEAILFTGEGIREVSVSPDGVKVVVLQDGGVLTILNALTGARIAQGTSVAGRPSLRNWNSASDMLAVVDTNWPGWGSTLTLGLDGTWYGGLGYLSPDFRHAVRRHGGEDWPYVPTSFDIVEMATQRTVHSVTGTDATFVLPYWWLDANRFVWFEMGRVEGGACGYDLRERPPEEGSVTAALDCDSPIGTAYGIADRWGEGWLNETSVIGPRVFDIASGAVREIDGGEWYRLLREATRLSADHRSLFYEGRPVWTGGNIYALGVIDLAAPLTLRVAPRDAPRPAAAPPPPARDAMVGPLAAWSEHGGYEYAMDTDGNGRYYELRRAMVHDEGTGRSWRAFDYRIRGRYTWDSADILPARGGFVLHTGGEVRYLTPDGQARTLIASDRDKIAISVSPSGGKALVSLGSNYSRDVTLAVFALPSGEEMLRIDSSGPQFEEFLAGFDEFWGWSEEPEALLPGQWNADETAFVVWRNDESEAGGLQSLDGGFTILPADIWWGVFSPDLRYAVQRVWVDGGMEFHIVDAVSGRVARTVPIRQPAAAPAPQWLWTADGRFAWSTSNGFDFDASTASDASAEVRLLNVETGDVERLSAREYSAGEYAEWLPWPLPERLLADCPASADPFQVCAVLLDGEVVGRGQWAEVVGVVAID